jgi:hypothetical protein
MNFFLSREMCRSMRITYLRYVIAPFLETDQRRSQCCARAQREVPTILRKFGPNIRRMGLRVQPIDRAEITVTSR